MRLALLFLMSLFCSLSDAQKFLPEDIPSPNTQLLCKMGDIPSSSYSGQTDISIPIYSTKIRNVPLFIDLRYDMSGFRVNALPSWTGYNWSLEAGGCITRICNGSYDELKYPAGANLTYTHENYFKSFEKLLLPDISTVTSQIDTSNDDMAPDIFVFNFCGHHGRFFLDHNGEWQVTSDENIDVIFDIHDDSNFIYPFIEDFPDKYTVDKQPKTIKGFTLKTDDGTSYHFGGTTDCIEYSTDFFRMGDAENFCSWYAQTWYLSEIKDKYGQPIYTFHYNRGKFLTHISNAYEAFFVYEHNQWMGGSYGQEYETDNRLFPYCLTLIAPVYLEDIVTANGVKIRFGSQDIEPSVISWRDLYYNYYYTGGKSYVENYTGMRSWQYRYAYLQDPLYQTWQGESDSEMYDPISVCRLRKLHSIAISAENYEIERNERVFNFHYSNSLRLLLSRISIHDVRTHYAPAESLLGEYGFSYNKVDSLPVNVLTRQTDHWGYYNAAQNTSYGENISNYQSYYPKRSPNPYALQYGMLHEIKYPTGGVREFLFEPNDFSSYTSYDRQSMVDSCGIGGGLRIKEISDFEDDTKSTLLRKRTFIYTDITNTKSSGELSAKPRYLWEGYQAPCQGNGATGIYSLFRSTSVVSLVNSNGVAVGYSYVREHNWEPDDVNSQVLNQEYSILYHFSNFHDFHDEPFIANAGSSPSPYDAYADLSYARGRLMDQTFFDSANAKTRSIHNHYSSRSSYIHSNNIEYHNYGNSASFSFYSGGIYRIYYDKYLLESSIDSTFYSTTAPHVVNQFTAWKRASISSTDSYLHSVNIAVPDSTGVIHGADSHFRTFRYPFEQNSLTSSCLTEDMFCLAPVAETEYINGRKKQTLSTIYKQPISGTSFVVPAYETITYGYTEECDTLITYTTYSNTGALTGYRKLGENGKKLVWGKNDCYLFAQYDESLYPLNMPSNINCMNHNVLWNYLITFSRQYWAGGHYTFYTYNPLYGIKSINPSMDETVIYEYDPLSFNLSCIKDKNGRIIQRFKYNYR